jgi:hypothetical protein
MRDALSVFDNKETLDKFTVPLFLRDNRHQQFRALRTVIRFLAASHFVVVPVSTYRHAMSERPVL